MAQSTSKPLIGRDNNSSAPPPQMEPMYPTPAQTETPSDEPDLRQLVALVRRRSLIIAGVAIAVMAFTVGFTLLQKPVYGGRFRMLIEPVNNTNRSLSGLNANAPVDQTQSTLDYETQIQVLLNPALIATTIEHLQDSYTDLDYSAIVDHLTIERLKDTKILEVRYDNTDQAKAKAVLGQLSKDYLAYSLKERQTNLRQGIQFIDDQLPSTRTQVNQLQKELQVFRQQNNFIEPDVQTAQNAQLASQIEQLNLEISQASAQARSAFNNLKGETGAVAALNDAAVYQQLVNQLRQVETQIATERTRFNDDTLAVQVLREQRDNLLPVLQDEAKRVVGGKLAEAATQMQTLEVQRQAIAQAQAQLNQKVQELPVLIRRYTDLQRELQVSTESLNRLLITRESLQIEASQSEIPWQLVDAPRLFGAPISPKIPRNLILGALASVILGFAAGVLVDKLDDVYHSVEELKAKTRLPLLGVVPLQSQLQDIENSIIQERKPLASLEALRGPISKNGAEQIATRQSMLQGSSRFLTSFQVLRTKIQLLSPDQPIRSMVVSSALPRDGKSTVAIYLAQTAAEMGQRVLLVDADFRQSQLQTRLNLNNLEGLSDLIAQRMSLHEVIYQPLQEPGFFILPAGATPPNPIKLLSSHGMQQFMAEVTEFFDLVIYDAPSMEGLADTSVLAPHTDGILLVVRLGRTERFALTQTLDNLKMSQMPVLGVVANGL